MTITEILILVLKFLGMIALIGVAQIIILIACHWAGDFYRLRPLRLAARRVRKQPN